MHPVCHSLRTEVVLNPGYSAVMTTSRTIAIDYDEEMKNTRKLLERVPLDDGLRCYKPPEKSMSFDGLPTHVAEIPSWTKLALATELFELPLDYKPHIAASTAELLAIFDKAVEEGRAGIAGATDADMEKNWTFRFGDRF